MNAAAALAHLACVFGGPSWYRYFGAGDRMVRLVEQGSIKPTLITPTITGILAVWSAFAFSTAGLIARLPLLRPALMAITIVYLLRAMAYPLMARTMPDRSAGFVRWSFAIVFAYGLAHAAGLVTGRQNLN
jgi:hypothetical protein